ncbi:MAG: TonB family protein [Candidatus Aminicenantes bacterium]|nr:TonB family protein [Candidatus Aminicenantes bacterium]
MKFRVALIISVVFHLSLFVMIMVVPEMDVSNGTTYYVDLISLPGAGTGSGGGAPSSGAPAEPEADTEPAADAVTAPAEPQPQNDGSMKDLAVKKAPESSVRYPDKKSRSRWEPEQKPLVSVTRKKPGTRAASSDRQSLDNRSRGVLNTRISGGSGGDGPGGGGGGPGGAYGTGNFPYAYYVQTLRDRISGSWYRSLVSPGLQGSHVTAVYFRIDRGGRVSGLKVEKSSGVSALDLSARRAVEDAAPFPPLPDDFPYSHLLVHFEFEWVKK